MSCPKNITIAFGHPGIPTLNTVKVKSKGKVCIWDERVLRVLFSRSSNLGFSPSQGHCVVFLGKET